MTGRFKATPGELAATGGGWSATGGDLGAGDPPGVDVGVFPSAAGMQVLITAHQAATQQFAQHMDQTGQLTMTSAAAFGQTDKQGGTKIGDITGPIGDILGDVTGVVGAGTGAVGSIGGVISSVISTTLGTALKGQGGQQNNPNNYGGGDDYDHSAHTFGATDV